MNIQIDDVTYTVVVRCVQDQWTAHAVRSESGERYGVEVAAPTESEATLRLTRWLQWQREHTRALEKLQDAERAYHRAVAGAAFSSAEAQITETKPSRAAMDAARNDLDDVRARRPNV
ncbi:MAG: hypothetical protein ABMA15_08535 [Vicinamibacterales bacterium]